MREFAFAPLIKGLREFQKNQDQIVIEICKSFAEVIAQLNRSQMFIGKESTGEAINPPYTIRTVQIKAEKHQITDHVTLRDEGNFYAGMKPLFKKSQFTISSTDKKTKKLTEKYGDDIFGLTEDSKDDLREKVKPVLQTKVRELIGIS